MNASARPAGAANPDQPAGSAGPVQPDAAAPVHRLDTADAGFQAAFGRLLERDGSTEAGIATAVADIIADVRARGDAALLELTRRFDRVPATDVAALRITPDECARAWHSIDAAARQALETAAGRIRMYHERQRSPSWDYAEADGTRLGQRVLPIDRVGLYVPGGKAAYPSSVLMNAIPARVAGVGSIAMVVPTPGGERNPMVLAAAHLAGIDEVWAIGGAQAVAALAWGTASIRPVDKIVGPGNAYVAEAKRRAFGTVGIDMIAGPSEILVVGDDSMPPDWIAMDLFSQAEHDEMAQSILISTDAAWLDAVRQAIVRLLPELPRRDVIARSLADRGVLVHARDVDEIAALVNQVAPEHLELAVREPGPLLERIRHAGAVFIGRYASESLGDYCAGPSHVLPTMRTARFSSPLGVYDFQKRSSLIEVSHAGAQVLGRVAATLARGEGLEAHARSAETRLDAPDDAAGAGRDGDAMSANAAGAPAAAAAAVGTAATAACSERASTAAAGADATPGAAGAHERVVGLVRTELQPLGAYHVAPSAGLVKLDAMENPYGLPQPLRDELGRRLAQVALNRYPAARHDALEAQIRRVFAVPPAAGLVVGNGSDELIAMLATLLARPGATMLAPTPGFVMYRISALFAGLRPVEVALDDDFQLDGRAMLEAIRTERPALVFLAYPNNPTGACWDRDVIAQIIDASPGLVVIDEAYEPFAPDSWMAQAASHPNVVVMRTLSKWGLAGVRLGFLAGPRAWTDALDKVRPPYNVSVLNATAATFALEHSDEFASQAARLREQRGVLSTRLAAMPGIARVFASDANFVLVRIAGGPGSATRAAAAMRAAGVLVKDTDKMAPALANTLRLTVGTPADNERMLDALRDALHADHRHGPRPA